MLAKRETGAFSLLTDGDQAECFAVGGFASGPGGAGPVGEECSTATMCSVYSHPSWRGMDCELPTSEAVEELQRQARQQSFVDERLVCPSEALGCWGPHEVDIGSVHLSCQRTGPSWTGSTSRRESNDARLMVYSRRAEKGGVPASSGGAVPKDKGRGVRRRTARDPVVGRKRRHPTVG